MDRNLKIGVVGLGLIGGSIFKALCALKCDVFATSSSNKTVEKALKYSQNVSKSFSHLKACDIVFVCAPMNKTAGVLNKLNEILSPKTVVTDVCSLKRFICENKYNYKFIPSHPMAGTEFTGFDNSFESLFSGAKWVITPFKETKSKDKKKLKEVIEVLGAIPVIATPEDHDEAVALISHMPMLLSQAIFKSAQDNGLAMKLASSGFRDMTRLALTNEEMAKDMIDLNSDNIQMSLLKLYSTIGKLLEKNYPAQTKEIRNKRKVMYVDGKNIL